MTKEVAMNIRDILIGIAIGDALGAGVEFQDRDWIRNHVDFSRLVNARGDIPVPRDKIELFTRHYTEWDYTDDTEMTIGVLKALISQEPFTEDLLISHWKAEYDKGIREKGYGRNGHGSMAWYYSGEKSMSDIRDFQRNRHNPGNAPAMRSVLLGFVGAERINRYAAINANATHPNINAVISSQCIARASEYLLVKKGSPGKVVEYCMEMVELNAEYTAYLKQVDGLGRYDDLTDEDFQVLCGNQPIQEPYFLPGIKGVPSDSRYTTGAVLFVLKNSRDALDALRKSVHLGGDVDSVASIATGIFAGLTGLDSLPPYMKSSVEGLTYLEDLAMAFEQQFLDVV